MNSTSISIITVLPTAGNHAVKPISDLLKVPIAEKPRVSSPVRGFFAPPLKVTSRVIGISSSRILRVPITFP